MNKRASDAFRVHSNYSYANSINVFVLLGCHGQIFTQWTLAKHFQAKLLKLVNVATIKVRTILMHT